MITRPYYILKKCAHINLLNTCLMDFTQTILLLLGHNIGIRKVFHLDLHYLKTSHPHFFSITRPYYIIENCPHMSLSNTFLMDFTKTMLVLLGSMCRNQGGVSPRSPLFEDIAPPIFSR